MAVISTQHPSMRAQLLADEVDKLGTIKAAISTLDREAEEIREELIAAARAGLTEIDGAVFRATVSFADRPATDWAAVVEDLRILYSIDPLVIADAFAEHTTVKQGVATVRVNARRTVK